MNSQSNIIFSEDSTPTLKEVQKENKKISYWLEKLHIQREQMQKNGVTGKDLPDTDINDQPILNQSQSEKNQDLAQSGINENTVNVATKKAEDRRMVNDLVKKSNRRIISISSIFPLDLFPTTIEVEESRVTFHFHQLLSSQSHSIDIKDISNVFIESSIILATLQVVSRTYVQNEIRIGNLSKKRAHKVHRIIEGLRTFAEHDINTSNYEVAELIAKIEELHANKNIQ